MEETFALSFSTTELLFVSGSIGVTSLLLPDDPYRDWSAEDIKVALARTQESLSARGYITVQPDGAIVVDTAVAALTGALAFAETSLTVTQLMGAEERPVTRRVHYADGLIVEQEQQHDRTHSLTAVRSYEVMARRLEEYLRLADQPAPLVQSCTLPVLAADEAHRIALVEGEQACARFLESEGVPADVASSLAQAMACPVCQSSLLALAWEGQEANRLDGFTLLEGQQGLWLLHPLSGDSESKLEATPCDAAYAKCQVEELAHLVVPSAKK